MAISEHTYYASFGYHVNMFYAISSRFGTPIDFMVLLYMNQLLLSILLIQFMLLDYLL